MRKFNITGSCNPRVHYMVDLHDRLTAMKAMVDDGQYFIINRARQYGKTTTIKALQNFLQGQYVIVSLDFQRQMSYTKFQEEQTFSIAFADAFLDALELSENFELYKKAKEILKDITDLVHLFKKLCRLCQISEKPIVLIIDEVDSASNNQVFLDFLAQLRGYYLDRYTAPTFQSVILAGVHDIRNLRQKIRPDTEHKHNSPWNIASRFNIDMSFSPEDIAGMLTGYENDHHTGMDIATISQLIYDYTSGYPVLVSSICKIIDEELSAVWIKSSVLEAVKQILTDKIPLFESMINKLEDDLNLRRLLYMVLFMGRSIPYNPYDASISIAETYGFLKNTNGSISISNRIFETMLCDWYLSQEITENDLSLASTADKNQFITNGRLNMELVLERFVQHFNDLYGDKNETFLEEDGRRFFLLYLRPIINGTGNYYIESQTRNLRRTDVIVDYLGEQFVIEMKIWHGDEYNTQGEQQLSAYLDYYHIDKGYLLSFNFNKKKSIGIHHIQIHGKEIVEAIV